jgi:hypothetical protein
MRQLKSVSALAAVIACNAESRYDSVRAAIRLFFPLANPWRKALFRRSFR